jgi:hypothetical protein
VQDWLRRPGGGRTPDAHYVYPSGPTADLWRVPGSAHIGGDDAEPDSYEQRLIDFFDRALLAPRR